MNIWNIKNKKIAHDSTKHYPNKDEARLIRKIKADTGLSEKEIREHKKYRKILSEVQKSGQKAKHSEVEKFYGKLIKRACQETKLAKEHPKTIMFLDVLIEEQFNKGWHYPNVAKISANKAVKHYKKIC